MRVDPSQAPFVLSLRRDVPAPTRSALAADPDVVVDIAVPPAPPSEVLESMRRAAEVAEELHMRNRELHFHKDAVTGRIIVEVRDLRGAIIRTIPPSTALEMLAPGAWR